MNDRNFERRSVAHAAWGADLKAWVRQRPARVDLHRSFTINGRKPCPTCGVDCEVAEATDNLEPSIRFDPVDREHLEECERAILDVRETLLDEALLGENLYDEHLGPCVGSAACIAGLAQDVASLLRALKRDNDRLRDELAARPAPERT